jgi:Putative peptidoglycan binding domain
MGQQLILLAVGFGLTGVLGTLLGFVLQNRAWAHQHEVGRRDEERLQALKTFEEVSLLLDRRLYRMRRLYWAARRTALGSGDEAEIASARDDYREVVTGWNDSLNHTLALTEASFGSQVRAMLADRVYEEFAAAGRGLEDIVRMVLNAGEERLELPAFGYRMTRLSHRVYELNVQMLNLLREETVGRSAPRGSPAAAGPGPGNIALEIGDQGRQVRALQRGLRRTGENIYVDGLFRQQTWAAVCSLQRSRGLNPDGIAGPQTWAQLPATAPMPLLRLGSRGDSVAGLQGVLTREAPGRWETKPTAVTGTFDASTSAAVQAFQRWNGLGADGLVGDQTWAALASNTSLEDAVGLEHLADEKSQ